MEQLSLPYRIALLSIAVLGAVWFVALRPHTGSTPAAATNAPGVTGLSHAIDAAHGAVAQSNANAAAQQSAATAQTGDSTVVTGNGATPIKPAARKRSNGSASHAGPDRSGPILATLTKGHVAVVAFSGSAAGDDQGVRRAVRGLKLHNGRVTVSSVPIADVADYGAITRGVQVVQSPTVLVIGHDRKAQIIVGYTDSREINQLVDDVGGKGF